MLVQLKGLRGMWGILVFILYEAVYTAGHDLIFFKIFS